MVNWFRTDDDGSYLWPGFGDNFRVIKWVLERCAGTAEAAETPIGYVPAPDALDLRGLGVTREVMEKLLYVDRDAWIQDVDDQRAFFAKLDRLPADLIAQQDDLLSRLGVGW